ncbi:MAG: 3'-5' exonuclease [Clostridia bacterium]|nr:3'-5' exonuclease [Clostridia bacterium]
MGPTGGSSHAKPEEAGAVALDFRQREFVQFQSGCAVLHAPVGTGKTLVLAERAAEAIRKGAEPSRILCVTFTNRAAEELRQRIALKCGSGAKQVVVRTFHSLCAWMLRSEAKQIDLPVDFVIFDDDDSKETIRACANRLGIHLQCAGYEDEVSDACNAIMDSKLNAADAAPAGAPGAAPSVDTAPEAVFSGLPPAWRRLARVYQKELSSHHALDFADLVHFARAILRARDETRERWATRFSMIQVDEMQDTHMSEYQVLRVLAKGSGNLVLAGDYDQTIYEWRGSQPEKILSRFEQDFPGVRSFSFVTNYRTTRTLVDAARSVAALYSRSELPRPCDAAEKGQPIVVHFADDSVDEARWIAAQVSRVKQVDKNQGGSLRLGRIGVLTRTNTRGSAISAEFATAGIPHLTVEQFEFFRRQEVKDAIAYLRFLSNPFDGRSLRRMLLRPARNIGERTIDRVQAAEDIGLRLADMANPSTLQFGDPFAQLLRELDSGSIVVFDTETTGLNPAADEIVEIAAVRLHHGQPVARLHHYIRNSVSVDQSELIHGLSDQFLATHGVPPSRALEQFLSFADGALLVGHNVGFDIRMVRANSRRLGLHSETRDYADTLEIARRFVDTDDRSLEGLVRLFDIPFEPTHRAMDDANATAALLMKLAPLVRKDALGRMQAVRDAGRSFMPLAAEVSATRALAEQVRPWELLIRVLDKSGLGAYYHEEPLRMSNLHELVGAFREKDDEALDPISSLENTLQFVALARNVDRIDPNDERVRILTVHQSKGLEFDTVFVAGLSQHEFPGFPAVKEGREEEELRVFYVALTRARRQLFLTGHSRNNGKHREPSPYFGIIGDGWVEPESTAIRRRYANRRRL